MKRTPQKIPFKIEDDKDVDQDNFDKGGELMKINDYIPEETNNGSESIRPQLNLITTRLCLRSRKNLEDLKMISEIKNNEVVHDENNELPDTLRDLEKVMDNPKLNEILYENKNDNDTDRQNDSLKVLKGAELPPQYGFIKSMAIDRSNRGENTKPMTKIIIGNKRKIHQMSHNHTAGLISMPTPNNYLRSVSQNSDHKRLDKNRINQECNKDLSPLI